MFCYKELVSGIEIVLVTTRISSCGKVMFSQAYVKNSVHRGRGVCPGRFAQEVCPGGGSRGRHPQTQRQIPPQTQRQTPPDPEAHTTPDPEADTPKPRGRYHSRPRGRHPPAQRQTPPRARPLPEMTTEVGSTHPTGMHSCL